MDSDLFDSLTRSLGSRRRALTAVFGGTLTVLGLAGAQDVEAGSKGRKKKKKNKKKDTCPSGTQWNGKTCEAIVCPPGTRLNGQVCESPCLPADSQKNGYWQWNGKTCVFISCPQGTQVNGQTCEKLPPTQCHCSARECGDNGCNLSCGFCQTGEVCTEYPHPWPERYLGPARSCL